MPTRLPHDLRVFLFCLAGAMPGVLATLALLCAYGADAKTETTVGGVVVGVALLAALAARERVLRPLQTAANLLSGLREGDFSVRGRGPTRGDPLGELLLEINQLATTLREQRLEALESAALLRTVMDEIDVAVLAFDDGGHTVLGNRAAETLLGVSFSRLLETGGLDVKKLGLAQALEHETPRTVELELPGGSGRFEMRRGVFRLSGRPHQLIMLTDLGRALREEERLAWQRLVRVLGHEINNSLAPIHSIAEGLQRQSALDEDLSSGLAVIERRAASLMRFMSAYTRLARLPQPQLAPVEVASWVRRVAALENRIDVHVELGPEMFVPGDADQLDQLLINLVRNAADAALETGGGVTVTWAARAATIEISVADEGLGLTDTGNLFVPFFTTKVNGSGIGLALSRQIAEQHGGSLALENRRDRVGCIARLSLPRRDDVQQRRS